MIVAFGGIQTPDPVMFVPADRGKLTKHTNNLNKWCAIVNRGCRNKGNYNKKICLLQCYTKNGQTLPDVFPICCS